MKTAGRVSPTESSLAFKKWETHLSQRNAVVSAPPGLGVRAATQKLLILEKHIFVFLNRPSPFLSPFLAESPSAGSEWACCEGVKFLTAAWLLAFTSPLRVLTVAARCVLVQCPRQWSPAVHWGRREASAWCAWQPVNHIPTCPIAFSQRWGVSTVQTAQLPTSACACLQLACIHPWGKDHRSLCA